MVFQEEKNESAEPVVEVKLSWTEQAVFDRLVSSGSEVEREAIEYCLLHAVDGHDELSSNYVSWTEHPISSRSDKIRECLAARSSAYRQALLKTFGEMIEVADSFAIKFTETQIGYQR